MCESKDFRRNEAFMNRRDFLRSAGAISAGVAFPKTACLLAQDTTSVEWRTFE
jgi:TAT (twin-arginine translocation) pathway signal sequence